MASVSLALGFRANRWQASSYRFVGGSRLFVGAGLLAMASVRLALGFRADRWQASSYRFGGDLDSLN
jgi:hypothetical protein